jgi:2-phospho-L-lactate guanylyltransferase
MPPVESAVLVPVKTFGEAKARLAPVLDDELRAMLARWTADRVFLAAAPLPVYVVCDSADVAEFADSRACTVLWKPGLGLNAAVQSAVDDLGQLGHDHVVVAHGDLPRAQHLIDVVVDGAITLCPDLRSDGTNVVSLPVGTSFTFSYGPGSFRRHLDSAIATGRALTVRRDSLFALDIDTPNDLDHPLIQEVLPKWMPMNRDSRPKVFPWVPKDY